MFYNMHAARGVSDGNSSLNLEGGSLGSGKTDCLEVHKFINSMNQASEIKKLAEE